MLAPQAPSNIKPASLKPPKQAKLLGATVRGVGVVTSVSVELPWCFALVEDGSGREHHVFLADLGKDNVTFPAEPQPYHKVTRRIGFGLWGEMYDLRAVPFCDLTHVDSLETAA